MDYWIHTFVPSFIRSAFIGHFSVSRKTAVGSDTDCPQETRKGAGVSEIRRRVTGPSLDPPPRTSLGASGLALKGPTCLRRTRRVFRAGADD